MDRDKKRILSRREFIKGSAIGIASLPALNFASLSKGNTMKKAKIALVKTQDRKEGVNKVLRLFDFPSIKGKRVLIKPNFNTADPAPGSTHNDSLSQLIKEIWDQGASEVSIGERSGPPPTEEILEKKGIPQLAKSLDFKVVNFEKLGEEDWVHFNPSGNHWQNGFYIPKPVVETEYVVSTCCLKTHQYGGVFTLSLKLAVGLTPKKLMRELHRSPDMRKMIAEINLGYKPQLIVLDGIEAFVDGGPSEGTRKNADVFLAGTDRVAIDAAGIAVLKELGSNDAIMGRKIFDQEQIKRAQEINLGISSPDSIEFVTPDKQSQEYAEKLKIILAQG